ncbi:MAG TPA: SpoIIE family protein phosphatase [Mycobacteriales bacterium]
MTRQRPIEDPEQDRSSPFAGNSAMAAAMRAFDWAATPLGPSEQWQASMKTACRICLTSQFPILLWCGPELRMLYNDTYLPMLGEKHPAIGAPGEQVWAELWPIIGPMLDGVVATGEATWSEDQLLPMNRHGYWEEAYFTFSYSPIHAADGTVSGVFTAVSENTERVIGERRLHTLRKLGGISASNASTPERVLTTGLEVLSAEPSDVPAAVAYLVDEDTGVLRPVGGFGIGSQGVAPMPTLPQPEVGRAFEQPHAGPAGLATGLRRRYPGVLLASPGPLDGTPLGDIPPDDAMVLPITAAGRDRPVGVLVTAVSPTRALDDDYRTFFELVAGQVSTAATEALAYQAERRRADALTELDRAKSEFFANVSHEFRTPLILIAGPAEDALADSASPLPASQRERMQVIRRNAGRLRRLVDDMLDFARIEAGRLHPEMTAVDLSGFTTEIVESFAPAVERAGLALRVVCPPLPRPVSVDVDMWEKVLLNLLSNAVKYTRDGSIEISLQDDPGADRVELTVADTGIGIPAEERPLVFERFHRVRGGGGRSHEGAGIGLALVHEMVRLHDGTVEVASSEGKGAVFTVHLPYGAATASSPEAPRGSMALQYMDEALQWETGEEDISEHTRGAGRTAGASVLIVEDNSDLRTFLKRLLEPHWRVLQAADGRTGLRMAQAQRPDLVLSDVMMPELDGFGLLRELRSYPATAAIPVIFLSARAEEESTVEGLGAGADDYLPKPFSATELVARVRSNLELARVRTRESEFRRALVDSLQEGLFVSGADGTVVEVNTTFGEITGYGPEGAPYDMPYPWLSDDPYHRQLFESAATEALQSEAGQFIVPLQHRDGRLVWAAATIHAIPDQDRTGKVIVGTLRDVTAARAAAERESAVASFVEGLATATGVSEVLGIGLVELQTALDAVQAVAAVWPSETAEVVMVAAQPVESWAALSESTRVALETARHDPVGRMRVEAPAQDSVRVVGVTAPLGSNGDAAVWLDLGDPSLLSAETEMLFELLVANLGQALDRARRYDQAREVALTLQHAILAPTDLPPGFAARYEPAVRPLDIGGDWYDVTELADGQIGVVVGDCVGHGLAAAAVMGQLRSACRALLLRTGHPGQVLDELDAFAHRIPDAACTTVFCATIDPATGTIAYSSAGHPPPVLSADATGARLLDEARSLPLATLPTAPRPEATATLAPGATLLLYTDGLIERRGEPLTVGIDTARRTLSQDPQMLPDQLADRLLAELMPINGYEDDVAVLIYRYETIGPLRRDLPVAAAELADMRHDLRAWLNGIGAAAANRDAVLVAVSEACTNSIEHAGLTRADPPVRITAELAGDRLSVVVTDTGSWKTPEPDRGNRGRGLMMMRALMDHVALVHDEHGTSVRMAKDLLTRAAAG